MLAVGGGLEVVWRWSGECRCGVKSGDKVEICDWWKISDRWKLGGGWKVGDGWKIDDKWQIGDGWKISDGWKDAGGWNVGDVWNSGDEGRVGEGCKSWCRCRVAAGGCMGEGGRWVAGGEGGDMGRCWWGR